jgi:hypothetical protein
MLVPDVLLGAKAGFEAVILMTLFEFPFWRKWGLEGVAEWQMNSVIVSLVRKSRRTQQSRISWTIGGHLFHGTLAGVVFGLSQPLIALVGTSMLAILLSALVYSTILWAIFSIMLRGTFEAAGGIRISNRGVFVALLSHLVYGFFLGLFVLL